MPKSTWLPREWADKGAWLEAVHHAARRLRRDVAHATPVQIRHAIEAASLLNPGPWGGEFTLHHGESWSGAVVTWKGRLDGTVLWIHGGAFAFGSPRVYRAAAVHLARATGCRVVLVAYRLAPECTFPAAHDDVDRALSHWLSKGEPLVVVGDSAGGNLAASSVQSALKGGHDASLLRGLALLSPWGDLRKSARSMVANRTARSPFDRQDTLDYSQAYLAGHPADDPRVSPALDTPVEGWPSVYLEWAEDEFLAPDIATWRAKLAASGTQVHVRTEPFAVHGWQLVPDLLPEARRSVASLGRWVRERLGLNVAEAPSGHADAS